MAKNKLGRKGPITRLVLGSAMVTTAAVYAVLSPVITFTPFLTFALPVIGALTAGGITLDVFAIRKLKNISRMKLSQKDNKEVKAETIIEKEPEKIVTKQKEQVLEHEQRSIKTPAMDNFRADKYDAKNVFAIYEVDGKTIKRDYTNKEMKFKISGDETYERAFRDYIVSSNSGDCIVKINDASGNQKDYFVHGDKYAVEFPRKQILELVSKIRTKEMEMAM